jgi:signal transduction histidine kinase
VFTKLRTRLTVIFLVLTAVPVVVIAFTLGYASFTQSVNDSLERQRLISARASQSIEDIFTARVNELTLLGTTDSLGQLPIADVQGTLSNLMRGQAYHDIEVIKSDGQERVRVSRFATVGSADLANHAGDALFQNTVKTGRVGYSDVYFDSQSGEPLLTIAVPFTDQRTGTLSYVIFANFRFHLIWDLVAALQTESGQGLELFLTDTSGAVIAHANPTIVFRQTVYKAPGQDGQATGLDGSADLVTRQNISLGGHQFNITATETTDIAYTQAREAALNGTILTLLTVLIAAAVIVAVSRQIVHPIEQLSQVAQAIRDGDLNAQATINRSDEIGKMAQVFNSMTAQLRQTLKGLQDHVEELEKARFEREMLIKDLQAAKRLADENSRLKSEFLSTMSHELRTPLNAIEGFTGIILNKIGGTDYNVKTEGYLTRIRSNSKRLLQLINDFLDLSRVEAGRLELANQPFSPERLAKRWQEEIGVLADKKGLELQVSLDSSLPETLFGDEEAISKVALNLLGNAIKFTEKGQVVLALERVDGTWGIVVEDTGIGIPPHAREFIFEEFRQVDQTSRRKYGGTGLGLAIVQKYTRAMGGTVQVKSEFGKGSTFSVSLPLKTTA